MCVRVCVCVCVRARVCVCMCVCVVDMEWLYYTRYYAPNKTGASLPFNIAGGVSESNFKIECTLKAVKVTLRLSAC